MNLHHRFLLFPLTIPVFFSGSVTTHALEPNGIAFGGGWAFFPSVEYSVEEDSNPYKQDSGMDEIATITRIRPELELTLDSGKGLYSFGYWLEQGAYSTNANDNYTDQSLLAAASRSFGRRLQGSSELSYTLGHDARGAGVDEGVIALSDVFYPDEWRELSFDASVSLGADASTLGFTGYGSLVDKNYLNNFDRGTADREYQDKTFGFISYLYVSPVTNALVEVRRSRVDYQSQAQVANDKEGVTYTYFAGAEWDVSGKTSGSVKLGKTNRSFDNSAIESNNAFSWEVALDWSPRSYSTVMLETSRGTKETSGPGVFVLSSETVLGWEHQYSVFFSTDISANFIRDEYFDEEVVERKDTTWSLSGELFYSPSRSMDLAFQYTLESRESDIEGLNFDRNVFGVSLSLAI